jgi:hypothetical protein
MVSSWPIDFPSTKAKRKVQFGAIYTLKCVRDALSLTTGKSDSKIDAQRLARVALFWSGALLLRFNCRHNKSICTQSQVKNDDSMVGDASACRPGQTSWFALINFQLRKTIDSQSDEPTDNGVATGARFGEQILVSAVHLELFDENNVGKSEPDKQRHWLRHLLLACLAVVAVVVAAAAAETNALLTIKWQWSRFNSLSECFIYSFFVRFVERHTKFGVKDNWNKSLSPSFCGVFDFNCICECSLIWVRERERERELATKPTMMPLVDSRIEQRI